MTVEGDYCRVEMDDSAELFDSEEKMFRSTSAEVAPNRNQQSQEAMAPGREVDLAQ